MNAVPALLAEIPSPTQGVWDLGPIPLRAYALCIVLGIVAACYIADRRLRARGAPPWVILDVAIWAVPFGIVGARLYHVITSPDAYFGENGSILKAFKIWEGGLGIWGGVAAGALGAYIACRRMNLPFAMAADTLAVALPVAQAIGRWGNWFNNELYGKETTLPWGLKVYNWDTASGRALEAGGQPIVLGIFHPTFLYESLWCLGVAVAVWLLDRKYRFGRGRAFAVYVMLYTIGRFWIEALRIDDAQHFLGLRLNNWTSIIVFAGALIYFLRVRGPQERVTYDEDGKITRVSPDAVPALEAAEEPKALPAADATPDAAEVPDVAEVPEPAAEAAEPEEPGAEEDAAAEEAKEKQG
ncbi:prolipoprotein diacylglyceryl transferase [Dactylosporangium vinaceum]|uniref:Phosphatidylglycerol--prolipoprotein diacylglyceryl transferase n=1 Tax=Dactylosporangium vinaceum TaxID=53362 RepID=A0ABV5MGZ3_9ACTN|nr:prolipoprotein diacylglyceryl transferase [Dactylosporangium vinaceum]UAB94942.1 prolipoprotein diacylglyceryl transferase [Dactylosporangium vinaceum]